MACRMVGIATIFNCDTTLEAERDVLQGMQVNAENMQCNLNLLRVNYSGSGHDGFGTAYGALTGTLYC